MTLWTGSRRRQTSRADAGSRGIRQLFLARVLAVQRERGEHAAGGPEQVAGERDAGARQQSPQQAAIQQPDDDAAEDPQRFGGEEAAGDEVREVPEDEPTRAEVDRPARAEQPRAEPADE